MHLISLAWSCAHDDCSVHAEQVEALSKSLLLYVTGSAMFETA